jgi:transglutaminase superfamily protein/coenzyme PQQ synthesis protein D (PqqD)
VSVSWQPSAEVVSGRLDDEIVLLNLRTNRLFALNRTGARFWELLERGLDRSGIRDALLAEFDVSPAELDQELDSLAEALASEGFVAGGAALALSRRLGAGAARIGGVFVGWSARRTKGNRGLALRMLSWSFVLPVLKHVVPLPALVQLMWLEAIGGRSPREESRIVKTARRVYKLRPEGTCLERSLLAYRYLAAVNADPTLVIGLQRREGSVAGHAWVLVDGRALYEPMVTLQRFTPVVEFGPGGQATTR